MKKISVSLVSTALSLFLIANIVGGVQITSVTALLILTMTLSLLNITIKPLLKLFSLPITILTLGLFSFVINMVVLKLAFMFVAGASLIGIGALFISTILLSVLNTIISNVLD